MNRGVKKRIRLQQTASAIEKKRGGNMKSTVRRSCLRTPVAMIAVALTACSPFLLHEGLDDDLSPVRQAGTTLPGQPGGSQSSEDRFPFAGDIAAALDAANGQRLLYFAAVRGNARDRNIVGASLITLSAWSVYKGITSDSTSTKRLLALAGATGAGIYGLGAYLTNREAEQAFLAGYRGITCLIIRSRPLLIRDSEFRQWSDDVDALQEKIASVDLTLSKVQTKRYQELEQLGGAELHRNLEVEFRHLYDALAKSRKLLNVSRSLQQRVQTAGFTLRRRVELVVANVNEEVHRTEHDLPKLESLVANYSNITKTFSSIKPVEQGDTGAADTKGGDGARTDATGSPTAPSAASTETSPSAPAVRQPAQTTLGKQVDAQVERNVKLEADNKKLKKQLEEQKKAPKAPPAAKTAPKELVSTGDREQLREGLSKLYALHRIVNARLVTFDSMAKSVKDIGQCDAGAGAGLVISPDVDELAVEPGQTYRFSISGGQGIPRAWLVGVKGGGDKDEITLSMTIENGMAIARVAIPGAAPAGTAYLVITDGSGKQKEEIALQIAAKKPESKKSDDQEESGKDK